MHFVINIMHFNSNMSTQGALYANQSSSAYTHTHAHSIMLCEHVSIIAAVRLTINNHKAKRYYLSLFALVYPTNLCRTYNMHTH